MQGVFSQKWAAAATYQTRAGGIAQGKQPRETDLPWLVCRCPRRLQRGKEFKHEWSVCLALSSVTPQHAWLALQNCLLQHNTCQKLLRLRFLTEKDWLLCATTKMAGGGTSGCMRQPACSRALFYPQTEELGRDEEAVFFPASLALHWNNLVRWEEQQSWPCCTGANFLHADTCSGVKKCHLAPPCFQHITTSQSEKPYSAQLILYP